MTTLILDIENDVDVEQLLADISALSGIKRVALQEEGKPKSETQLLIEKMERGEYVLDDEYFASIPGFVERLDEASREPLEECLSTEEVFPNWNDIKIEDLADD